MLNRNRDCPPSERGTVSSCFMFHLVSTHVFQRLYNVHNVDTTSYERNHDVVCAYRGIVPVSHMYNSWKFEPSFSFL